MLNFTLCVLYHNKKNFFKEWLQNCYLFKVRSQGTKPLPARTVCGARLRCKALCSACRSDRWAISSLPKCWLWTSHFPHIVSNPHNSVHGFYTHFAKGETEPQLTLKDSWKSLAEEASRKAGLQTPGWLPSLCSFQSTTGLTHRGTKTVPAWSQRLLYHGGSENLQA